MDAPGIRKDNDGAPLAEGEILIFPPAFRKTGIPTFVTIRGFGPKGLALRPELKLISGRMVRPGAQEIIVGKAAQDQLAGMQIGDKVILPNGAWPIVGVFSTGGDLTGRAIDRRPRHADGGGASATISTVCWRGWRARRMPWTSSKPRWPPIPPCR